MTPDDGRWRPAELERWGPEEMLCVSLYVRGQTEFSGPEWKGHTSVWADLQEVH